MPKKKSLSKVKKKTSKKLIGKYGSIENLIANKEDLKGNFSVRSNQFNLDDFSTATTQTSNQDNPTKTSQGSAQGIELPDFLDATLNFSADQVRYDGILLDNVTGTLKIAEQQAKVSNLSSSLFGGKVGLNGTVSTRSGLPLFDMKLDLNEIDIDQSFENLEMLRGLAPVAKALQGAFNTEISLRGQLDSHFSPQLGSIDGSAFAQLLTANINPEQSPLLSTLDDRLNFINLKEVDLDQLQTNLSFKNGSVQIKPFDFTIKDIGVTVSGGHSFENTMNYRLSLNVPAQYLGSDVSGLLSKLTQKEKDQLTVDLPIAIGGNFASPSITPVADVHLLTVDETRARLGGVCRNTLRKLETTGELEPWPIGKRVFYGSIDIDQFLLGRDSSSQPGDFLRQVQFLLGSDGTVRGLRIGQVE